MMEAAIKTAVGALLLFAALLIVIVVIRQAYERDKGMFLGDTPRNPEPDTSAVNPSRLPKRKRVLSFRSRAAKRKEAEESPADSRPRNLIMGGVVGGILGTLLVKLWSMQVISSETYTLLAEANAKTTYTVPAPRGRILDRNGNVLVDNRSTLSVVGTADIASDRTTMRRLSVVLGMPYSAVRQLASSTSAGAQADRIIAQNASQRAVAFISEHPGSFPNVYVESRTVRSYPYGSLAAHVLGYTGTISAEELEAAQEDEDANIAYESGDTVGKAGAEYEFESVLQGVKGERTVEVDAQGSIVSLVEDIEPQAGNDVRLTIDLAVQQAAEEALAEAIQDAKEREYEAVAGAIVCLDVTNGAVVAMASNPTYEPERFIGGISTDLWDSLTSDDSGYPLTNRAITGLYPAASTFKAFTGMAGLQYGYASATSTVNCTGTWTGFGEDWPQNCWDHNGHGQIGFVEGIVESCDVVFYEIARQFYRNTDTVGETALQDYLMQWGFGSVTGLDLPAEAQGRVPTPQWKSEFNKDAPEQATWVPGDFSNLIIGQGDLLVTPLQIASGYGCVANNGIGFKPHILQDVRSRDGKPLITYNSSELLRPEFTEENIKLVQEGLAAVVSRGHVADLFSDFQSTAAGKTGTGEVAGKDDYAWYVGYAPVESPKYVCSCVVEQGGSGGETAAPAVRAVLATALGISTEFATSTVTDDSR